MRQLPVMATVEHAIKSAVKNFPFAVHVSWPWMVILAPVVIASNFYILSLGIDFDPGNGQPPKLQDVGRLYTALLPVMLVQLVAFSSIAVSWHRYILLDEVPQGLARLRLDGVAWRYIGNVVGIVLLMMIVTFGVSLVVFLLAAILGSVMGNAGLVIFIPLGLFLLGWAVVLFYRWSIKLPAIALGRRDYLLNNALRDSEGNNWRIFGVLLLLLLCSLAISLLGLGVTYIAEKFGMIGLSISLAVQLIVQWISTIVGITVLTSLYGFFVEGRDFPGSRTG